MSLRISDVDFERLTKHVRDFYDKTEETWELWDEACRAREGEKKNGAALWHAIYKDHVYAPYTCDGCLEISRALDAHRVLTRKEPE